MKNVARDFVIPDYKLNNQNKNKFQINLNFGSGIRVYHMKWLHQHDYSVRA
jgi:predicted DNA-binding ribbon-helix-helix protein